ncbi:metalloreductase STEAP4-like [Penaeus chinensis]|uniref:metalloreductase STEAP4-like n=1 Tax=Penaeus chinensis TaxID=139456 RepID=UPI001FB73D98|nr:metalloreductase STEAP4-like [Penaeus chinensis]
MELTDSHTNPAYETHGESRQDETNFHRHASSAEQNNDDNSDDLQRVSGENKNKKVVFIGSGDMTLALSVAMSRACLQPVVGSRHPDRAKVRLKEVAIVTTVSEALSQGEIVILAIPADHHHSLPRQALRNKIVVDISNRAPGSSSKKDLSLGETLQEILPESHVVKAFNTISAYALQHGNIQGSREVPICGNDPRARAKVSELTRDLGLTPVDRGALRNAREVEGIPLAFFPEWKVAGIMTLLLFGFWYIFMLFRNQICPNIDSGTEWNWELFQIFPLMNTQFAMAYTATSLLLFTYIPASSWGPEASGDLDTVTSGGEMKGRVNAWAKECEDDCELEVVHQLTYLGSICLDEEISKRIGKASTTLAHFTPRVWENSKLFVAIKMTVFNACILSALLYGSETWTTNAKQEKRLNSFHLCCLRRILNRSWQEKVPNTEVLFCAGQVSRTDDGRHSKDILYGELATGTRRTGRQYCATKMSANEA